MTDRELPTRPDLRFPTGVRLPAHPSGQRPRPSPPPPDRDAPTPVPAFTGDEREWFAMLLAQFEQRIGARLEEHGERLTALEQCSDRCGIDELRRTVEEATREMKEATRSLQDARERIASLEGAARGEDRATRRLAPWVRPAAQGAGGATVFAGIIALIMRAAGLLPATEPTTRPSPPAVEERGHEGQTSGE